MLMLVFIPLGVRTTPAPATKFVWTFVLPLMSALVAIPQPFPVGWTVWVLAIVMFFVVVLGVRAIPVPAMSALVRLQFAPPWVAMIPDPLDDVTDARPPPPPPPASIRRPFPPKAESGVRVMFEPATKPEDNTEPPETTIPLPVVLLTLAEPPVGT
jgi:hypothetical protein